MNKLMDKVVIFIVSFSLYMPTAKGLYLVVPILISIILSSLLSYIEKDKFTVTVFILYVIACFFLPGLLFFLPLFCYDVILIKFKWLWLLCFLPIMSTTSDGFFSWAWQISTLILVAYVLKYRSSGFETLAKTYHNLRDNSKEMSLQLERKNHELLEKQDYEINLATLRERNRIARDIHDNVGHLLSRSILQVGALLAINKDELTKESLKLIKNTLSEAMDSIRTSVHNLHEESIDLKAEMQKLVDSFSFCSIKLQYHVETNLEKNIKYCFIAVTKEALSNIIKHSNANEVLVLLREHPGFYQLIIQDNGSNSSYNSENGIGVKNIIDRVTAIGGNVNISYNSGFRIFISIDKQAHKAKFL